MYTHKKLINALLVTFLMCCYGKAFASDMAPKHEDIEQIKAQVEKTVLKAYQSSQQTKISAKASNLDSRLRLAACSVPKSIKLNGNQLRTSNTSVRVSCNGESPWSIFVPVRVEVFKPVAIATRDIYKGDIISKNDVVLEERNLAGSGFGYSNSLDKIIGQAATRNISSGNVVRTVHVAAPIVVKRGDKLTLRAGRGSLSVSTSAVAMSKGRIGDRIRVKNERSKRVIDAEIIAPGHAVATL